MNPYESFRRKILERAAVGSGNGHYLAVRVFHLATEYDLPEDHVCEQPIQLAAQRLISLTAWD